jgi:hypothetical protein
METVTDATRRLQAAGYVGNWYATPDGTLRCDETGEESAVDELRVDEVLRFEGQSDPGDMMILFALEAPSGQKGIFSAAFSADTTAAESDVIRQLRRRHAEGGRS